MKTVYRDKDLLPDVVIDLMDARELTGFPRRTGWVITNIYTSPTALGQGRASRLLDQVCNEADAEGVRLHYHGISTHSVDGLDTAALQAWGTRKGFQGMDIYGSENRNPAASAADTLLTTPTPAPTGRTAAHSFAHRAPSAPCATRRLSAH